ncbi:hypothetical protein CSB37_02495 [bacterium DOLZORAL124_38_8]|nr:MAG: hypothetical protein CSB37_02495 [bacterium DOLZORAL124_38_8]
MAQFGSYGPIDALNPADEQNSVLHDEQQLENMANSAESLVLDTYNDARGTSGGQGFEGIFDDLSYEGISRLTSVDGLSKEGGRIGRYQRQIRERTMSIINQSPQEYLNTLNNSSSAALDKQVIQLQQDRIRTKLDLDNMRQNSQVSLSVAKLYRESVKASREKVMSEWQYNKELNEDVITNRSWFRKNILNNWVSKKTGLQRSYDRRSEKFKQTWVGRNISKRSKLKRIQDKLEPKLSSTFDELDKKINTIESAAEKRVTRMENKLKRAFRGAKTENDKKNLWEELNNAVRHDGSIGTHLAVPSLGITLNARHRQEYVDMLEALKRVDFIRDGLHAIGKSTELHARQKDVIASTKLQEDLVEDSTNYKFDEVLKAIDSKIPASKDKIELPDLVQKLEEEFHTNDSITVNPLDGDGTQLDLMTDSYKLIKIVNFLGNHRGVLLVMDRKLQSELKGWIEQNYDSEAVGNTAEYTKEADVQVQLDVLQNDGEVLDEVDELVGKVVALKKDLLDDPIGKVGAIATLKGGTEYGKIKDFYAKEKAFASASKSFNKKDKKIIEDMWKEVFQATELIENTLAKWETEALDNKKHQKDINKAQLDYDALNKSNKNEAIVADGLKRRINELNSKIKLSDGGVSLLSQKVKRLKNKSVDVTKNASALESKNDVFQRILTENFQQEMEKKALDNMEANDQFEMLAKCPKGMQVEIEYKKVNALNSIKFPKQLEKDATLKCFVQKVEEKDGQKVIYLKSNGAPDKVITLMGPAIKDGKPMKNGYIKELKDRPGVNNFALPHEPEHGGAGIQIMTTNMKIKP